MRWVLRLPLWALALSLHAGVVLTNLSIQSQPAFTNQRACLKNCLWCGQYWEQNCDAEPLAGAIGCYYSDQIDACYCATVLQSSASSYITACVLSGCNGDQSAVSTAQSIYNGYCRIGLDPEQLPAGCDGNDRYYTGLHPSS